MKDIGRRILEGLDETVTDGLMLREPRMIVADEILPSELAMLDHSMVLGIVTERGDSNSHAAIMTRSLGIPAILGISNLLERVGLEDELILDGTSGRVFVNPQGRIRDEYERLHHDYNHRQKALEGLRDIPASTPDGFTIPLRANIGLLNDIMVAHANGAEGVGLYRTEFPYMARRSFPSRDEQYQLYRKILEGFPDQPVTIRTLDIGGDKGLSDFPYPHEDNPFMGWRSIRVSLDRRDIFQEQLAAVLMAAPHGKARLLLPMIASVEEIRAVRSIVAEVSHELDQQGVDHQRDLPIGIMIELPAAVQTADILLREADFASIGSNDLIQYTLAADRNNPLVRQYYTPHHPAVLSSIHHVVQAGKRTNKPVSLCGEMAADPIMSILLLGLGIKELSIAAPAIPPVKQAIRSVAFAEAEKMAQEALALISAQQVMSLLNSERKRLSLP
jgi:phosphotransferase system enzyme I (PtsP)